MMTDKGAHYVKLKRTYDRNDSKRPAIPGPKQIFCASNIDSIHKKNCFDLFVFVNKYV